MKKAVGDETPIVGVVMSPFSLPVMQLGFEKYLELLLFHEKEFDQLMRINEEFCVSWANAQLEAGATAICYFDPLASPTMIERERYLATGHKIAKRTISRIKGPTATHLASGIALPVLDDIAETGTAILGFSDKDDLVAIKQAARNKISLLGNLNGIDMPNWTPKDVERNVRNVITKAGAGGGLILSDNHGEIPWQVSQDVLHEISEAVGRFGTYPLKAE
jgi:uroporphyrinogen decarboxylase